jgi:hypothetical protein
MLGEFFGCRLLHIHAWGKWVPEGDSCHSKRVCRRCRKEETLVQHKWEYRVWDEWSEDETVVYSDDTQYKFDTRTVTHVAGSWICEKCGESRDTDPILDYHNSNFEFVFGGVILIIATWCCGYSLGYPDKPYEQAISCSGFSLIMLVIIAVAIWNENKKKK